MTEFINVFTFNISIYNSIYIFLSQIICLSFGRILLGCINKANVIINVIIDKTKIERSDYSVLENALTYNIQRIENNSGGDWNYFIITDPGRIAPMRKTARKIRAFNPIESMYNFSKYNQPISYMVEDIFEKDSRESYFVQICDFISYFVFLYYRTKVLGYPLKNRITKVIDIDQIEKMMDYFRDNDVFNLKANKGNPYGFVIYPK